MVIDLETYRSAVGIFNNKIQDLYLRYKTFTSHFYVDFLMLIASLMKLFSQSVSSSVKFILPCILNLEFSVIVLLLVIMSGDVLENPGPDLNISADSDSLSITHLNIRSIRNKINYIEDSLADFDILCFTETHLNHAISNEELFIEGFQPVKCRKDVPPHTAG